MGYWCCTHSNGGYRRPCSWEGLLLAGILLLIGRLLIGAGRKAGMQAGSAWRLAMAGLQRRASANSVQMLSFSTAIMLLLLVIVMRNDLLADWQRQLPADAPNYFALNIAEEKVDDLRAMFAREDVEATDQYPLIGSGNSP